MDFHVENLNLKELKKGKGMLPPVYSQGTSSSSSTLQNIFYIIRRKSDGNYFWRTGYKSKDYHFAESSLYTPYFDLAKKWRYERQAKRTLAKLTPIDGPDLVELVEVKIDQANFTPTDVSEYLNKIKYNKGRKRAKDEARKAQLNGVRP